MELSVSRRRARPEPGNDWRLVPTRSSRRQRLASAKPVAVAGIGDLCASLNLPTLHACRRRQRYSWPPSRMLVRAAVEGPTCSSQQHHLGRRAELDANSGDARPSSQDRILQPNYKSTPVPLAATAAHAVGVAPVPPTSSDALVRWQRSGLRQQQRWTTGVVNLLV